MNQTTQKRIALMLSLVSLTLSIVSLSYAIKTANIIRETHENSVPFQKWGAGMTAIKCFEVKTNKQVDCDTKEIIGGQDYVPNKTGL